MKRTAPTEVALHVQIKELKAINIADIPWQDTRFDDNFIKVLSFRDGVLFDLGMIVLLTVLFFVTIGVTAAFAWMRTARSCSSTRSRSGSRYATATTTACWW